MGLEPGTPWSPTNTYEPYVYTYADAFDSGYILGWEAAVTGQDTSAVVGGPGWASGNLQVPLSNGWKAGVEAWEKEQANAS